MTFREELLGCKVEELMTKDPITTSPQVGVIEAFEIMLKHDIGALPVVDDEGRLIGLVTRTDLGRALLEDEYEPGTTIEEVMERNVIVVHPDDTLLDALKRMASTPEGIYNQLPVVDDEGKLVGILTDGDILRWIAKKL
ncbi:CBS domain-containing protein [Methanopyrus sp. KOL6]|uniref:CBS domain-containing protein n=1 Tax=Methanopyrus sp. KOL6 TaxID=1937004 RepID=UPI0018E000A2|nr:CBS domain-containing protein [Methanopyrus sp. KOL6]